MVQRGGEEETEEREKRNERSESEKSWRSRREGGEVMDQAQLEQRVAHPHQPVEADVLSRPVFVILNCLITEL